MVKGERVTISTDTKASLAKMAKPFESVDECLKRLISLECVKNEIESAEGDDVVAETDGKA